jgi:tetratricopeptide (TPR) repeat protein
MLAEFRELLRVMGRELAARSSAHTVEPITGARGLLMQGLASEQAGDFDAAIQSMQQAAAADPHNAEVWNSLAWVHWRRGEADEAIRGFDRALAENEHCTMAWVNKGIVLKAIKRHAEALVCYQRAVSFPDTDPEDAKRAWHNMAALYWERGNPGDLEHAQSCVDRALAMDLNYSVAQRLSVAVRARKSRPPV